MAAPPRPFLLARLRALDGLRRSALTARKWLRRRRRPSREMRAGRPPGLSQETVDSAVLEMTGARPGRIRHHHLSSWKRSGAYRVVASLADGRTVRLVFKDCDYSSGQLPAARRFPIRPGPAELEIYRLRDCPVSGYLPRVHHLEEVVDGTHFRVLMDDLADDHRSAFAFRRLLTALEELPTLQSALTSSVSATRRPLPEYGTAFAGSLAEFAHRELRAYAAHFADDAVRDAVADLDGITRTYLAVEPDASRFVALHGDYNPANLLVDRQNRLKAIDWEWAGTGPPHVDLAKLLKSAVAGAVEIGLDVFARAYPQWSRTEHRVQYERARLERALIDASYLAAHRLHDPQVTSLDIPAYIRRACRAAAHACRSLERLG